MRLLRSYNKHRDATVCGQQRYMFFFDLLIEIFVYYILVDICAITDPKNIKGVTITRWLKKLVDQEKDSVVKKQLIAIQKKLNNFCKSKEYKGFKTRRDKFLTHRDEDRPSWSSLAGGKYRDIFGAIEKLQSFYDDVAAIGNSEPTDWIGKPDPLLYKTVNENKDMTPEEIIGEMLEILERDSHEDNLHRYILKRKPTVS